jgi:hypothetical protein
MKFIIKKLITILLQILIKIDFALRIFALLASNILQVVYSILISIVLLSIFCI